MHQGYEVVQTAVPEGTREVLYRRGHIIGKSIPRSSKANTKPWKVSLGFLNSLVQPTLYRVNTDKHSEYTYE